MHAMVLLLTLAVAIPGAALAQGFTLYETYTDPLGTPETQPNLTPLPDDTALLGPAARLTPPWLGETRPPRDFGEIADPFADYWEWRSDRLRQIREGSAALDFQRRSQFDRRNGTDADDFRLSARVLGLPGASLQPYPPLYGQASELAPVADRDLIAVPGRRYVAVPGARMDDGRPD